MKYRKKFGLPFGRIGIERRYEYSIYGRFWSIFGRIWSILVNFGSIYGQLCCVFVFCMVFINCVSLVALCSLLAGFECQTAFRNGRFRTVHL